MMIIITIIMIIIDDYKLTCGPLMQTSPLPPAGRASPLSRSTTLIIHHFYIFYSPVHSSYFHLFIHHSFMIIAAGIHISSEMSNGMRKNHLHLGVGENFSTRAGHNIFCCESPNRRQLSHAPSLFHKSYFYYQDYHAPSLFHKFYFYFQDFSPLKTWPKPF